MLYGNRARWVLNGVSYPEHLNSLIHHGARTASIVLEFDRAEAGQQVRYSVERSWHRTSHRKPSDRLVVSADGEPRPDLAAGWAEFAEGIMPVAVAELAIFDGEKIESLADPASSAEVLRTSIYGLLGLGLVDRLRGDLRHFRRRTANAHKAQQPELIAQGLADAETALAAAEQEAASTNEALADAETAKADLEARLHEAKDNLAATGGELLAARDDIQRCLAEANAAAGTVERELLQLAARRAAAGCGAGPRQAGCRRRGTARGVSCGPPDALCDVGARRPGRGTHRRCARPRRTTSGPGAQRAQDRPGVARAARGAQLLADAGMHRRGTRDCCTDRFGELQATAKRLTRQLAEHDTDIERLDATLAAVPDAV